MQKKKLRGHNHSSKSSLSREILEESHEKLRTIIDYSPHIIFTIDLQGNFLFGNKTAQKILGSSLSELTKSNIWKLLVPEYHKFIRDLLKKAHKMQHIPSFEVEVIAADGKRIPLEVHTGLIKSRKNKVVGIQGIARDITEQKKVAEELRKGQEKYRSLTNQLPIGIYRTTKSGKFLHANPALAAILEYDSVEELMKTSAVSAYDNPKERNQQLKQWKAKTEVVSNELKFRTKKGKQIWVKDTGRVILDKNGEIEYIDGTIEDITERKQAEEALQESEAKYSALVEQAQDGVIIIQDGICKFINKATIDLFGYTEEEIIDLPFLNKVAPESKELVAQRYKSRMEGKKAPSVYEAKIICRDGTVRDIEISAGIIQYQGKPADMAIIRDISERKKAMEKINKAYQEAEDARMKLKAIIDNAPNMAIQGYNLNGEILFWNPASEKLYGYKEEEVKGKGLGGLILSESDEKKFMKFLEEIFKKKKPAPIMEWTVSTKKRDDRFILSSIFPITQPGQEPLAVCMDLDITERKKAEERIKEISRQIEKFSAITADILSIENEKELFDRISQAVVDISDFNRVLISFFKDQPPYREIIGHKGVKKSDLERVIKVEMPREKYLKVFDKSIKLGNQSCYIPYQMKHILDQNAVIYGEKTYPTEKGHWHREDNLLVFMKDVKGQLIGIISVDDSKSGLAPTDETVRPLEIFANLISGHIQRRILARQIKESEEKYRELVSNVKVGIFRTTPEGKLLEVNPSGAEMFGYKNSMQFLSLEVDQLYQNSEERVKHVKELEEKGIVKNKELKLKKKDSTSFWANMTSTAIRDIDGKIMYHDTVIEDITDRKKLEEDVKRLSITDELTGLLNRRYFNQNLPKEIKRAERLRSHLSLIMIDIDDFKQYNDLYHHLKGDEILKRLAHIILNNIRKDVDWASRFGGEEFTIILPGVSASQSRNVAERIRKKFHEAAFKPKGKVVHKTISLGVADCYFPESKIPRVFEDQKIDLNYEKIATSLTNLADRAMFKAKELGKNTVIISKKQLELL